MVKRTFGFRRPRTQATVALAAPALQTAPYIHVHSGAIETGNTASYHAGVYTGNPGVAITWVWQNNPSGVWTDIAGTANTSLYTFVSGDVGLSVRVQETGTNSQGASVNNTTTLGPVTAAATPSTISTPTNLIETSTPGADQFQWSVTIDNTIHVGDIWRLQTSADNTFASPTQNITKMVSPEEFEGTSYGNWTATSFPPPSGAFATPTSAFYMRMRVERVIDDGGVSTTITSGWVTAGPFLGKSSGSAFTTTGKSSYITLSNSNKTAQGTHALGGFHDVRGAAMKTGSVKLYAEFAISTIDGNWRVGVDDGSRNLTVFADPASSAAATVIDQSAQQFTNGSFTSVTGAVFPTSGTVVVRMAVDLGNDKVWFGTSTGGWKGGEDPATNTGGNSCTLAQAYLLFSTFSDTTCTIRTTAGEFTYAIPSGFAAFN